MKPDIAAISGYGKSSEPPLLFSPERQADRDIHPLRGLMQYGPYSKNFINKVFDPIRVATIFPAGMNTRVRALFDEFERSHTPQERKDYRLPGRIRGEPQASSRRIARCHPRRCRRNHPQQSASAYCTCPTPHRCHDPARYPEGRIRCAAHHAP